MELDPKLALLATAAVAPTKLLVDYLATGIYIPARAKLAVGFLLGLTFIVLYQAYTGDMDNEPWRRLIAGDLLAAFTTLTGAVLVTQGQKLAEAKKIERKKHDA